MKISQKQNRTRINDSITVSEVRLIGKDNEQLGVMPVTEALVKAQQQNLDLVEISPNAEPPVCKVMDFGRYLFDIKKKKATQKKKQHVTQIKEIKFRPTTEKADYQVKLRKITEFLSRGDRVKITMRLRGREINFRELGVKLFEQLKQDVADIATVERDIHLEGRQFFMLLTPGKSATK